MTSTEYHWECVRLNLLHSLTMKQHLEKTPGFVPGQQNILKLHDRALKNIAYCIRFPEPGEQYADELNAWACIWKPAFPALPQD